MRRDCSTAVSGWLFLRGALMFWCGWTLMQHHAGTFFKPDDSPAINRRLRLWLWMDRVHLFGLVTTVMALVALAAALAKGRLLPAWICAAAALIGPIAMAVTLALPNRLESYAPVFHLQVIWLLVPGAAILRRGIGVLEPKHSMP